MINKLKQYPRLLKCLSFIVIVMGVKIYEYFVAPLYAVDLFPMNQLWLGILTVSLIVISTMILEIYEGSIFADTCFDADYVHELGIPFIIMLSNIYICNLLPLDKVLSMYTIAIHIKTALYGIILFLKIIDFVMKIFDKK